MKEGHYKGFKIYAEKDFWVVSKYGFLLGDCKTIDGGKLQSVDHSFNDAKKNIDKL